MLSRVWSAAAAACLICCGSASAQSVGDTRAQASYADWRRLSQTDLDCVEQALRARRSNLRGVIQSGIGPNDAVMAPIRAECRIPVRAASQPRPALSATQALASVDTEATRRAADRLAAEKAAEKAFAEKIAAERAAAQKAAEDKAAAQQAAEQKAATDRIAAAKSATDKAATDKAAADRTVKDEAAANKALAEKATVAAAKADAERAAETVQPAENEHPPQDVAHAPAEPVHGHSVWESRISFVYGLMIGPIIFCFGGVAFLMVGQRNGSPLAQLKPDQPESALTGHAAPNDRAEFDRLVATVAAELNRRQSRQSDPPTREPRTGEAGLH